MINNKEFGKMAALKGSEIVSVQLDKAVGKLKIVPKTVSDKLFKEYLISPLF